MTLERLNLELERWFRLPKSHERRIHGHRHAGIRLVLDGPTLVHALDAHAAHPGPFTVDDLLPYRTAREPPCQTEARNRRTIMRKARSKKQRPLLLVLLCQIGPVPPDVAYFGANTPRFRPRFSRLSLKHGGPHLSDKIVLGTDRGEA